MESNGYGWQKVNQKNPPSPKSYAMVRGIIEP